MNPHAANQLFNPALFHKAVINIIICFFPDCHPEALTELPRTFFRALSGSDSHSPVDSLEATDHADKITDYIL